MAERAHLVKDPAAVARRAPHPTGVFPAKLRAPHPAGIPLVRPRLHTALDDGVDAGSVIITAPAGSGKTQLVASWVQGQRAARDVAWLTLDEGDCDPVRAMKYAVAALGSTPAGHNAMHAVEALPPLSAMNEAFLLAVSDAMSSFEGGVVLVLDDFQAVVGSETEALLRRIMRSMPEAMHLIVLSRVEPALGQEKLRLEGVVRELGARDLSLTSKECADLLTLHGAPLSDTEVTALWARTEGWMAGVSVIAASLQEAVDPAALSAGTGAGEMFVSDYLMAEVFDRQPPELQEFLLRASIANPVCGDLADVLTGSVGGSRTLGDLYRSQVFLDRIDEMHDERCLWFRWHPMFAELLRSRLHATDPGLEAELHRKASQWLHGHGVPVEAVRHAVAGGDVHTAAAIFGESWLDLVVAGESPVVQSLLGLFEETQRNAEPELTVACAFVRIQDRDLDRAAGCAAKALSASTALPSRRRLAVEVMATVVRLHAATMTGGDGTEEPYLSGMSLFERLSANRRELTETDRKRGALLAYHLGAFEVSLWMYEEPRDHLYRAMAEAGTLDMPDLVVRSRAQLAFMDFFSGRFEQARTSAEEVIRTAEARGWRSHHSLAMAHLALGAVEVFRGQLDSGLHRLAQARHIVHPVDRVNRFRIGFTTLTGLRAAAQVSAARAELEALEAVLERWPRPPGWVRMMLRVAEAEQLAMEHRPDEALALMESMEEAPLNAVGSRHRRVFLAQLLLRAGEPAEARREVEPVLEEHGRWPIHIRAMLVEALACDSLGLHEQSLQTLTLAVDRASAEQVVEPFLVTGQRIGPLLVEALDRGSPYETDVLAILDRMGAQRAPGGIASTYYVEPLTARELEVLGAMQGTASNEEIAKRLFVSLNTLRTHMKHINRKLGTTNRREAVARGRELAIL